MTCKSLLTYIIYLLIVNVCNSQNNSINDDSLLFRFRKEKNFSKAYPLIEEYINKKRLNNDSLGIAQAYYYLAYKKIGKDSCFKYLDTSFYYAYKIKNEPFIASLHWLKGQNYYANRDFKKALQSYINADKYAKQFGNQEYAFRSSQSIGLLNNRIGNYKEALEIFRENYIFAKRKNYKNKKYTRYLKTVFSLADVFNNLNVIDSAIYYNKIGLEISKNKKHKYINNLFLLNQGNTLRKKKLFRNAIDTINIAIEKFEAIGNKPNIAVGNFFLGMAYHEMGEKELSVKKFAKVDSIFNEINDLLPRCRKSYRYLIKYYKETKNHTKQLYYTNQLLKLDSVLTDNYKYISKTIYNELEKPKLISDRKELEEKMNLKTTNYNILFIILSLVILSLIILFRYTLKRKKRFAKLFSDLMEEKQVRIELSIVKKNNNLDSINKDVINSIIEKLNEFEANKEFLDKNITLTLLAKSMNTNSTYLSKVINNIKGTTYVSVRQIAYCGEF